RATSRMVRETLTPADWVFRRQRKAYFFRLPRTYRMTPAARAFSGLGVNVVHDVIIVWFAGNDYRVDTAGHVVEFEYVTRLPYNVVIGARVIAGNPKTTEDPTVGSVERKATAKDVDTARAAADQKVAGGAIFFGITAIHRLRVDGIRVLETKQRPAGL